MAGKQSFSHDTGAGPRLSRRRLLGGAGALALLAALEACRLTRITPTSLPATPNPTSTQTPTRLRPSSTPTSSPTPRRTPTLSRTPTEAREATLEPTVTPTPGETPTPTPTPYPPGPPSKLGLFVTRADGQIDALVRVGKPALVKTLNLDPNLGRYIK